MSAWKVGDFCGCKKLSGVLIPLVEIRYIDAGGCKVYDSTTASHWYASISDLVPLSKPKDKGGRPKGTPGGGRYGCRTKVVRVPESIAPNIDKILLSFEDIKALVDTWEETVSDKSSLRYDKAKSLLCELRSLLD